jgi:hypothetical protein
VIVALDGQPCEPHEPADRRILLGPAMRADVMLEMQGELGRLYSVTDDFYGELSYELVHLPTIRHRRCGRIRCRARFAYRSTRCPPGPRVGRSPRDPDAGRDDGRHGWRDDERHGPRK